MEGAGEPSRSDAWLNMEIEVDLGWVHQLDRKFGWPEESWMEGEGLKAITEYVERRKRESEKGIDEWWRMLPLLSVTFEEMIKRSSIETKE